MEEIIERYFDAFCTKDINKLSELYDDNIVLSEWDENIFTGKEAVLGANKKLFSQFENISIVVVSRGNDNLVPVSLNEIIVNLDGTQVKVVDIITIVNEKIVKIMAYRGF